MGRAEDDIKLYYQYKKTGQKKDFQNLYRQMLPAISRASQKASYNSHIPQAVFKLEAAQQFFNAVNNYDPKFGVKLSTYVHSSIEPKLNRVNYTYQNIARIPERGKGQGGVAEINQLLNAEAVLRDRLNREPTDAEIAQEMGITIDNVTRLRNELRRDLSLNAELDDLVLTGEESAVDEVEALVYYDLPPEAQLVYDYARGKHGKPAILKPNGKPDWKRIAKRLNMSEAKVQKLRKMIARQLSQYST